MSDDLKVGLKINAGVDGRESISGLAADLRKLGDTLDGPLSSAAKEVADQLTRLGQTDAAIAGFGKIKQSAADAAQRLQDLQEKTQAAARAIAASEAPTRSQTAELDRLRAAVRGAKQEVIDQTAALDRARAGLSALGVSSTTLAADQVRVRQALEQARQEYAYIVDVANKAADAQSKQAEASKKQGKNAEESAGLIGKLRGALEGLALVELTRRFFDVAAAQQANQKALEQLTGSAQAGAAEMEYLRSAADRLGVNLDDAARAYVGLSAATKGTNLEGQNTKAIFEAVVGAMSKLGKSSAETQNALLAVSQMASKGTISMEDLRGQLGEALPGAMQAAAKAMGVTVAELDKMVSTGTVTADELLPKLADQLNKTFGSAPPDTLNASLAQLENKVTAAVGAMTEAGTTTTIMQGAMQAASGVVAALADIFNSAAEAVGVLGKGIAITFIAIQKAMTGDFKGAVQVFKDDMADAMNTAALNIEKVRKSVGLLPSDAQGAGKNTAAALAPAQTAADQMATAFSGAGTAAGGMAGATGAASQDLAKQFGLDTLQGVLNLGDAFIINGKQADEMATNVKASIAKMDDATLASFTANLKTAFDTGQIGAKEFADLNNTALSESFKRLGLDVGEAFGGISKQGGAAINNLDTMVAALKSAGLQGKESGAAIEAALSAALNKTKTVADVEAIKARIESLRTQLGDKVTDGLLQQATEQMDKIKLNADKAKAGINSVAEAYDQLGIKSQAALQKEADKNLQAVRTLETHGASINEITQGWKKYLESAIAANGGASNAMIDAQAEMHGLKVVIDQNGKAMVLTAEEAAKWGNAVTGAANAGTSAIESQTSALEANIAAREKAIELADRERKVSNREKGLSEDGFVADNNGKAIVAGSQVNSRLGIINYLKSAGMDEATATQLSSRLLDKGGQPVWNTFGTDTTMLAAQLGIKGNFGPYGATPEQLLNALTTQYLDAKGTGASSTATGVGASTGATKTVNVNLSLPGGITRTVPVQGDAAAQQLIEALKQAGLTSNTQAI